MVLNEPKWFRFKETDFYAQNNDHQEHPSNSFDCNTEPKINRQKQGIPSRFLAMNDLINDYSTFLNRRSDIAYKCI